VEASDVALKRTGNITKALAFALLALALVANAAVIIARLAMAGDWGALSVALPTILALGGCLALPATRVAIGWAILLFRLERQVRQAFANSGEGLPLASVQPDRAVALRDGETITLLRRRLRVSVVRDFAFGVQFSILPPSAGGVLLLIIVPIANALDITFLALVVLFALILLLGAIWVVAGFRSRWQRITADDRGVTLKCPLSRRRFIPWNDIRLFARRSDRNVDSPDGSYLFWWRDHLLEIEIAGPGTAVEGNERSHRVDDAYRYAGGYDAYAANARRLLATVVARGNLS
jgi:hypothetical protein